MSIGFNVSVPFTRTVIGNLKNNTFFAVNEIVWFIIRSSALKNALFCQPPAPIIVAAIIKQLLDARHCVQSSMFSLIPHNSLLKSESFVIFQR